MFGGAEQPKQAREQWKHGSRTSAALISTLALLFAATHLQSSSFSSANTRRGDSNTVFNNSRGEQQQGGGDTLS